MRPDRGTPLDAQVQGIGLCLCFCLSKISVSVDKMYLIQWQLMLYHSEEALMLLPNGRMCGIFFIIWCLNATEDEVINMFI